MSATRLRDDVERWLIHAGYKFAFMPAESNHFTAKLKYDGSFTSWIETFCPKQQETVLVIGGMIPLNNYQNGRYIKMSDAQKEAIRGRIDDYCHLLGGICKFRTENGKLIIGIYRVLREDQHDQRNLTDAISHVADMGDKAYRHILKTV